MDNSINGGDMTNSTVLKIALAWLLPDVEKRP